MTEAGAAVANPATNKRLTLNSLAKAPRFARVDANRSFPRTPEGRKEVIARPVDTLDTMGAGVSTRQAIENVDEKACRGRFGRFGHLGSHVCGRVGVRRRGRSYARVGRRPKCPMCPVMRIYVYISKGCGVDTCVDAVSKVSTAINNARISGRGRAGAVAAEGGGVEGAKWGGGRHCAAVLAGDGAAIRAGRTVRGAAGRIVQYQGLSGSGAGLVADMPVEKMRKAVQKQGLSACCPLVGPTDGRAGAALGGLSPTCPPASAGGGTPRIDPPGRFVARFAVIAHPVRGSDQAEKIRSVETGAWGQGAATGARDPAGARRAGRGVACAGGERSAA